MQWLYGVNCGGERRITVDKHGQEIDITPDSTEEKKVISNQPDVAGHSRNCTDTDIEKLKAVYGDLAPGTTIDMELGEACDLWERPRRRVDSFTVLQKVLRDKYDVELRIYSRKTHV